MPTLLAALLLALPSAAPCPDTRTDPRTDYDVLAYDLQLGVVPATRTLEGLVDVVAVSRVPALRTFVLDLYDLHDVLAVTDGAGRALAFEHAEAQVRATLAAPVAAGEEVTVRVRYRGQPEGQRFDGFHWERSADGRPWINTACQGLGAHYWYPCKASYFHPDDKPERVSMAITCPAGLYGVSNGRLVETVDGAPDWFEHEGDWQTYRWRHDYPLETYTVTLNVGPYVVVEDELELPGVDEPVPWIYYVLPENAEKAAVQFRQVPELLRIFSEAFGPWPFPRSKFALVETNFWGMEHSTAVAYGSSYPAWCAETGAEDRYARRNRWFDYILVHEVAHEWWGNAVSAEHWGHFWLHEGFGTYAEGVYVEGTRDRAAADEFFAEMGRRVPGDEGRLWRGDRPTSGEAYAGLIYSKGATVLHTLRHYVHNDEAWWKTLRELNLEHRYGNASTDDFQAILERNTRRPWDVFFKEWFRGEGTPALEIELTTTESGIRAVVKNHRGEFHVPLDLAWREGDRARQIRKWFPPGEETFELACRTPPSDFRVVHLQRLLGDHEVRVVEAATPVGGAR